MTTSTYYLDVRGRQTIAKDPGALLDYSFDWTDFLAPITDTIASVTASAVGVTLVGSPTFVGPVVTVWAQGGTVGQAASITCVITTQSTPARVEPMTIQLKITPKVT
jgi:hypothetical protein